MNERFKHNGSLIFENGKALNTLEVVDLLNEQNKTIQSLNEEIEIIEEELKQERTAYSRCHKDRTELFGYKQKVKGSLTKFHREYKTMKQMLGANKLVLDKYIDLIKEIADELGVELE